MDLLIGIGLASCPSPKEFRGILDRPWIPRFCCSDPKLLEQKVLFLHFKLLLQRANTACSTTSPLPTFEVFFGVKPARNLRLTKQTVQTGI